MYAIADRPVDLPQVGWTVPIRNVPAGQCTYGCLYCCLGGTPRVRTRPRPFLPVVDILSAARDRVRQYAGHEPLACLTFLHGGEPTLDAHLGAAIDRLSTTGVPVAVMTNASLLWRPEVRGDLVRADRVLVKVDTVDPSVWRRMNRPARQLRLQRILAGLQDFRAGYGGRLDTETAVVPGVNDGPAQLRDLADFLERLAPARAYVVMRSPGTNTPTSMAAARAHVREALGDLALDLIRPGPHLRPPFPGKGPAP